MQKIVITRGGVIGLLIGLLIVPVLAKPVGSWIANSMEGDKTTLWFSCETNEDCVLAGASCARTAVNKKYYNDANEHYLRLSEEIRCSADTPQMPKNPVCKPLKGPCPKSDGTDDAASSCFIKRCELE